MTRKMPHRKKNAAGYTEHLDGDTFTLVPGAHRPYRFACCGEDGGGCHLVHDFYGRVTEDGRIEVAVYRNEAETDRVRSIADRERQEVSRPLFQVLGDVSPAAPRPVEHRFFTDSEVKPMRTRSRRRFIDDINRDAFDENGVLRDGATARFPTMTRDSQPTRTTDAAARIAEAIAVTKAAIDTEAAMALGDKRFSNTEALLHRPGFRLLADSNGDPGVGPGLNAGSADEWAGHYLRERHARAQLRDPMGRLADEVDEETKDSVSPGERARALRMIADSNAWRSDFDQLPDGIYFDGTRFVDADDPDEVQDDLLKAVPPPGGYWPLSAGIGSPCDRDGERGALQLDPEGSGFLVCVVNSRVGPTRSGASKGDSVPTSMSAEDAARINGEAYREYLDQLYNAWRT